MNRRVRKERKEFDWLRALCELCGFQLTTVLFTKYDSCMSDKLPPITFFSQLR